MITIPYHATQRGGALRALRRASRRDCLGAPGGRQALCRHGHAAHADQARRGGRRGRPSPWPSASPGATRRRSTSPPQGARFRRRRGRFDAGLRVWQQTSTAPAWHDQVSCPRSCRCSSSTSSGCWSPTDPRCCTAADRRCRPPGGRAVGLPGREGLDSQRGIRFPLPTGGRQPGGDRRRPAHDPFLSAGAIDAEHLKFMLRMLPVDVSFADEDDVLRYWSGPRIAPAIRISSAGLAPAIPTARSRASRPSSRRSRAASATPPRAGTKTMATSPTRATRRCATTRASTAASSRSIRT